MCMDWSWDRRDRQTDSMMGVLEAFVFSVVSKTAMYV
jgi:hypothetical protein